MSTLCNCLRIFISKRLNLMKMKKDAGKEEDDERPHLHDVELKDAVELTLTGQTLQCIVKEIVDCNTIRVLCYFYGVPVRVLCKFDGICSVNEPPPGGVEQEEKKRYDECMLYLQEVLIGSTLTIEFKGIDRFGKYMSTVFSNESEKSINVILVEKNFAYEYKGGKKLTFSQWNLP